MDQERYHLALDLVGPKAASNPLTRLSPFRGVYDPEHSGKVRVVMSDQSLSVLTTINYIDDYGINPIGNGTPIGSTGYYAGGIYDSVTSSITPVAGTTVTATQGSVTYNIPYLGGAAFPDQFYRNLPFNPALTGSWTLTITNPDASNSGLEATTPVLSVTTPPPLVTGINISGDGAAPTINWSIPAGSTATAETVFIFNVNPGGSSGGAAFASVQLPAGTTTYTIPAGVLTPSSLYSVSVQSDIYSGGGNNGNIEARSRQFTADFTASDNTITTPVYLPTVSPTLSSFGGLIYDFNIQVTANTPIVIDPEVAIGFIYQTGASDPNFASVDLPNIGNPDPYSLYVWNGLSFVFDTTLAPDTVFDFAPSGVAKFEVLGIEPSLGIDPNNAADFATQLTFTGSGTFTGTMTPVVACFLVGTRIMTERGNTSVEDLREDDRVLTVSGETRPVTWIGRRTLDPSRHSNPASVLPVRVKRDAFGLGQPHSDLFLSPDHAVFADGVLIPIRLLINGASIAQVALGTVTYYHVELDRHDVVFAEGLEVESYLDTGNRAAFSNVDVSTELHPDFSHIGQKSRVSDSYAVLVTEADRVERIWHRLAARAVAWGDPVSLPAVTSEPDLRLVANGRDMKPVEIIGDRHVFVLPRQTSMVGIRSRASAPVDVRPWLDDRRKLGVSISRIVLHGKAGLTDISVDHPALTDGWHDMERAGTRLWRWTDGCASLPVPMRTNMIEIHLAGFAEYPVVEVAASVARIALGGCGEGTAIRDRQP